MDLIVYAYQLAFGCVLEKKATDELCKSCPLYKELCDILGGHFMYLLRYLKARPDLVEKFTKHERPKLKAVPNVKDSET